MHKFMKRLTIILPASIILSFCILLGVRTYKITRAEKAPTLSETEYFELQNYLSLVYEERNQILHPLPYKLTKPELSIGAKSAILIDASNGNILYEKNADEIIPPASMTKLFSMYVVDNAVANGKISYDDEVPLPKESWACNMMPHSSLMFLGKGHHVTVNELLQGLSVCSGNDAAYALAYTISGNMENFVEDMNNVAKKFGLKNTHFVESSGYSEENLTTAREMAAFSKIYIQEHPDSLKNFHSLQSFSYPKPHNLADGDSAHEQDFSNGIPEKITMQITQRNTNPLLGILDGCDGLKTGYIDESGYNLSLTAKRNGTRFISITMGGPGANAKEGNEWRARDGKTLMDWAFFSFATYNNVKSVKPYFVRTSGGKKISLNLVPSFNPESITVPYISGESVQESVQNVKVFVTIPPFVKGDVKMGDEYGKVEFMLDNHILDSVPLVADRSILKSNIFVQLADTIVYKFISYTREQ